eukprot:15366605-Ditylum_brightwellii.AAC.1
MASAAVLEAVTMAFLTDCCVYSTKFVSIEGAHQGRKMEFPLPDAAKKKRAREPLKANKMAKHLAHKKELLLCKTLDITLSSTDSSKVSFLILCKLPLTIYLLLFKK